MRAVQDGNIVRLYFDHHGERIAAKALLYVEHPRLRQMQRRNPRLANWDGIIKHMHPVDDSEVEFTVAAGLMPRLLDHMKGFTCEYEQDEQQVSDIPFAQHLHEAELDSQQMEACQALLANKRCSLEFKTGSGKTEIVANAIQCAHQAGHCQRVLFIVPRLNLLYSTAERLQHRCQCEIGLVGDGHFDTGHLITVATPNTAAGGEHLLFSAQIREWLRTIDLLVLDEAHHATSDLWTKIIEQCTGITRLWAVSGKITFWRKDKILEQLALESIFGPPVLRGESAQRSCPVIVVCHRYAEWCGTLDHEGLLADLVDGIPCIYRDAAGRWQTGYRRCLDEKGQVPGWMLKKVITGGKTRWERDTSMYGIYASMNSRERLDLDSEDVVYFNRYDVGIVANEKRNAWAIRVAVAASTLREPFMITVKRRKHLQRLTRLCKEAGLNIGEIGGHLTGRAQKKVLDELAAGNIVGLVAIASTVSEGTDLPMLQHLIKCDGYWDEQTLEQQKGRVQRVWERPEGHPFAAKTRGVVHHPYDHQLKALGKISGKINGYFQHIGLEVKRVNYASESSPVELSSALL